MDGLSGWVDGLSGWVDSGLVVGMVSEFAHLGIAYSDAWNGVEWRVD